MLGTARRIYRGLFGRDNTHPTPGSGDSEALNYQRLAAELASVPRYTPATVGVHGWNLAIPDAASFLSAYKEIFVEGIYRFPAEGSTPRILDLGANIGLSVLFFKRMHPGARIIALEADPEIFRYLRQNVVENGLSDVQLVNKAAWDTDMPLRFAPDGADGGRVSSGTDSDVVTVEAADIREYLKGERFDLVKMDIEGAEEFVLPACADYLAGVSRLFVEYHSRAGRDQCLDRLLAIMKDAGYRVHVHSVFFSPSPFVETTTNTGFDLQLNIFGYRR